MLNNLNVNKSQSIAISHGDGAMLVLAGPGSGKTFVITHRIKYLIEVHKVAPEGILVITFTKAAATEMKERFEKLTSDNSYSVNFGTFHSIFFQILRHTYKFSGENIIRENQKYKILTQILKDMPEELENEEYGRAQEEVPTDILQEILSEISLVKNGNVVPGEFNSSVLTAQQFEFVCTQYKNIMNNHRLIDFDDMILLCHNLFVTRPQTLALWQDKFKYILIDEFQDINAMQYEIVKMLAKPQNNLFIVGDDDQSIYGFRGSRPEIMMNFKNDYPKAKQILLDVNYRSRCDIVETANRLIWNNKQRFEKKVTANNTQTNGVKVYSYTSKEEQAKNVAVLIHQYMSLSNASYNDIAILYRTNNSIVYTLQRLVKEKIPFTLKEKPKNIFDTPAAKDIMAYLRFSLKQDSVEDFYRIMNRPVRYIKRSTVPRSIFSMEELIQNNCTEEYVIKNICSMYKDLNFIRTLSPFSAINYIRKGIRYDEYAREQKLDLEQLDSIQESAKDFETIEEFLDFVKDCPEIMENSLRQSNEPAVSVVTMHASKGLEWKIVIIPDVNEKVVPHKKAIKEPEIEEERRLFYVAMTRAKERLFIFYISENDAGGFVPSRFISEIQG